MEMGDFMGPGQQALNQVEHRGAVKVFGISSLEGGRAFRMGQIVRTAYQEHVGVFLLSFHHYFELFSALYWSGYPSSLYSFCHEYYTVFCVSVVDLYVSFCQTHSHFLAQRQICGNFFCFLSFLYKG